MSEDTEKLRKEKKELKRHVRMQVLKYLEESITPEHIQ